MDIIKNNPNSNKPELRLGPAEHIQLSGMASYDEGKYFTFSPREDVVRCVPRYRRNGVAMQLPDGTFDFVVRPKCKTQSQLICKLSHGRVSVTKDDAVQLTLKVFRGEGVVISQTIAEEAAQAVRAIVEHQMKR